MKTYKAVYRWGGRYRCVTFLSEDAEEAKKNMREEIKKDIFDQNKEGPYTYTLHELAEEVNEPDKIFRTIQIKKRIG